MGVSEFHEVIRADSPIVPFSEQLTCVTEKISSRSRGRVLHFCRFFLSDSANQEALVREVSSKMKCPVSMVQQPPLDGTKIAAWCYWTDRAFSGNFKHSLHCALRSRADGAQEQTEDVFRQYRNLLHAEGKTIQDDCIRTWLFVRDVDTNYSGVVEGRRKVFDTAGLTVGTHFIASTGIQGATCDWRELVQMDAYSVGGLDPGQIRYLEAKTHLNPTYEYGVTFERATAVDYADRRHIFVSGTASIGNKGQILHEGDIAAQTSRMMENVEALLKQADASLEDIKMSIVYLRDASDYPAVRKLFADNWPWLDPVMVYAPVCRPGWLIEMECIAGLRVMNPEFKEI